MPNLRASRWISLGIQRRDKTTIKATYIVTDMDFSPLYDHEKDEAREFVTEKAAIRAAKDEVRISEGDEMWVWRLSHVVSKPDAEPDVETVKP